MSEHLPATSPAIRSDRRPITERTLQIVRDDLIALCGHETTREEAVPVPLTTEQTTRRYSDPSVPAQLLAMSHDDTLCTEVVPVEPRKRLRLAKYLTLATVVASTIVLVWQLCLPGKRPAHPQPAPLCAEPLVSVAASLPKAPEPAAAPPSQPPPEPMYDKLLASRPAESSLSPAQPVRGPALGAVHGPMVRKEKRAWGWRQPRCVVLPAQAVGPAQPLQKPAFSPLPLPPPEPEPEHPPRPTRLELMD